MIHIRTDNEVLNKNAKFRCGIAWPLPEGDKYYFEEEIIAKYYFEEEIIADISADCPKCNPNPRQLGTPISELSGRPGHEDFDKFCAIAESWGYD